MGKTPPANSQSGDTNSPPFFYLAPIRGITDALFRDMFHRHFDGWDAAVAPFINPQKKALYDERMIRDVLPENNPRLPIVPQLLHTDPQEFIVLAQRLSDLGYRHLNWNLGCPVAMVAKKRRGSGLLPYPEAIIDLLTTVLDRFPGQLSIKTRLGYHQETELLELLPRLEQCSLKEIIIHPRLGRQLYRGSADPEGFARCALVTSHELVYNGDIVDVATYRQLATRFPEVRKWMVGRGALANPFLIEEIKGIGHAGKEERIKRLYDFHQDLVRQYQARLSGPGHLLGRLKQLWSYLINSFPGQGRQLKTILKAQSEIRYREAVDELFFSPPSGLDR